MTPSLLKLLQSVDAPTVCNAIEVAQGKRGFNDFTRGTMLCSAPDEPAIVGYARTAKIAAVNPPEEAPEVIKERRMAYYKHMAGGDDPADIPTVAVVEDVDFPHCIGAYWGEINTTVHKGFGMAGALTNGVMRDLGDCPEGFPVVAGSIGPSHGFVHVKEIGTPVEIFGMTVQNGDLVHADRHGALVIPADVIDQLEAAILKLLETEKIVLNAARKDGFTFEDFAEAWAAFEKSRT
jgi:regulator of RNase E activity RraA